MYLRELGCMSRGVIVPAANNPPDSMSSASINAGLSIRTSQKAALIRVMFLCKYCFRQELVIVEL